jgi:hypothetical protein
MISLPKPGKDPTFPRNLRLISLLPATSKLFEKVILNIAQRHIGERGLLNANQFGFRASHNMSLQCMSLTDHVTLNFNNNMSTAAVLLVIEKAFDTTWHTGLLYKLSKFDFSVSLIKLISSFLYKIMFFVCVEGEMSTPRTMKAWVPQGSDLSPTLFNMYVNDIAQAIRVHLALFTDDICLYATERKEGYVLRILQRGLNSVEERSKRLYIKINEDKTQAINFSHRIRPPESLFTLDGRNIQFASNVKYLGVIFHKKITWRLHI